MKSVYKAIKGGLLALDGGPANLLHTENSTLLRFCIEIEAIKGPCMPGKLRLLLIESLIAASLRDRLGRWPDSAGRFAVGQLARG